MTIDRTWFPLLHAYEDEITEQYTRIRELESIVINLQAENNRLSSQSWYKSEHHPGYKDGA